MRLSFLRHAFLALLLVLVASASRAGASWGIGKSSSDDSAPPATPEPTAEATLKSSTPSTPQGVATPDAVSSGSGGLILSLPEPLEARKPAQAEKWAALCLAYFAFNYFRGKRRNAQHAHAIGERLRPMLESQFSHLGPGPIIVNDDDDVDETKSNKPPILLRESASEFVLWASGRRNLGDPGQGSGALLRLRLRPRQDAVSNVLAVAEGLPDQIEVTLALPTATDRGGGVPVALAVGRPTALKEAFEDYEDLKRLTKPVSVNAPVRGLAWWPTSAISAVGASGGAPSSGGLAAVSESAQALADLVASGPMGAALAASARASLSSSRVVAAHPKPRLRLLRLNGDGALRKGGAAGAPVLSAVFDVAPPGARDFDAALEDVSRLVAALLATADAVASYGKSLSPEARAKAAALRSSAAAAAAAGGDGSSSSVAPSSSSPAAALEAKRAAAREAEKQKLASMSNEAKEKYLLRKQRIEQKRLMKKRTVRG